jgi:hypothetical protein
VVSNISSAPRLKRSRSITDSGTSSSSSSRLAKYFLRWQFLFHVEGAGFHQQTGHLVLHAHRFAHHQGAIAQQAAQFANPRRGYIAGRQKIAAYQIGDGARVDGVALLLARADGFHFGRMRHL